MELTRPLLQSALSGDGAALRALVGAIAPVIAARGGKALARRGGGRGRDPRQELADLTQEVLVVLFRGDARVLRAWDPERGLSLLNYVGLVAEREIRQIIRSGRRGPWALEPTEDEALDDAVGAVEAPEETLGARDLYRRLHARLEDELSDRAFDLYERLVVEDQPVAEICAATGLSAEAVYAWRTRLLKRARVLIGELSRDDASGLAAARPMPKGTRST